MRVRALLSFNAMAAGHTNRRSTERRQADRRGANALDFRGLAPFGDASIGAEIIGYRIEAPDGHVGRVADFCVEEESSVVTGLLARTRRFLPGGKHVFVPLNCIARMDHREKKIYVTPTRDEVRRGSRRTSRCG